MATLTPTLTLTSSTVFPDQPLNLSVTDTLTVVAPMSDISRMATNDDIGFGAGVIIDEIDTNEYFIYIKHTGLLASDGTTASHITNDFVLVGNGDGDAAADNIKLFNGEFAFFPIVGNNDASDDGVEVGGLAITKGGADIQVEYAYYKRG